jgi:hypothetical protein
MTFVSPKFRPQGVVRAFTTAGLLAVLIAMLAACASRPFDPAGPCTVDGRAAGAYPDLEALIPREFRGVAPNRVDSGRNCSEAALGSFVVHRVRELRFAGATWDLGSGGGVSLAVFEADGLETTWVNEFFESGARSAKRPETVETGVTRLPDGSSAFRLDTLNGESFQTVIAWPDGDRVRVALIASFIREVQTKEGHEAVVADAVAAAFPEIGIATPPTHPGPG